MRPLALAIAVTLHLAAIVVLLGRFGPKPVPDEVPINLTLEFSPPAAAPTDSAAAEPPPAPSPPQAASPVPTPPASDPPEPTPPTPSSPADAVPPTQPSPPDATLPDPTPPPPIPEAVPVLPSPVVLPPAAPQVIKPQVEVPPPIVFRRPPQPVELPRPDKTRSPAARGTPPTMAPPHVTSASRAEPNASAAPAPSPQPPTAAPSSDPAWSAALSGWLQGHRNYPEAARRRGEQGSVGLRFTVLRDGHVQDVSIIRPSDFAALDTAALTMLQGTLVPEFPASMPQQSITVTVTVRFSLTK